MNESLQDDDECVEKKHQDGLATLSTIYSAASQFEIFIFIDLRAFRTAPSFSRASRL